VVRGSRMLTNAALSFAKFLRSSGHALDQVGRYFEFHGHIDRRKYLFFDAITVGKLNT